MYANPANSRPRILPRCGCFSDRTRCETMIAHARNSNSSEALNWKDHIVVNPDVLIGKPIIKGTRISVELLLDRFADGWSYDEILEAYPHLTREQVQAALAFAAELFKRPLLAAVATPRDDG